MRRWLLPVVAVATVGTHEVASACSLANFVSAMPSGPDGSQGSWPLLLGTAEAELVDANGLPVAIEVVTEQLAFPRTFEKRTAWRPVSALPAGQYTWRSHVPEDGEHVFTVDPTLGDAPSLTAVESQVRFATWGVESCEALGRLDALELTLSGTNVATALVELSDEAGTIKVAVVAATQDIWSDGDRDVGGPLTNQRSLSLLLRQDPLYWSAPTICAKVYAFNPPAALSAPIDAGCRSAVEPMTVTELLGEHEAVSEAAEIAEPSPQPDDDDGCAGGPVGSLAALALLLMRRR